MCGILGYKGKAGMRPVIDGLQALSYRGYDSWGIATINKTIQMEKQVGDICDATTSLEAGEYSIGHTRWATHGAVTKTNAHPQTNIANTIAVVHNGIIENHEELRKELQSRGFTFTSETDTEIIPQLLDYYYKETGDFFTALKNVRERLEGKYAFVCMTTHDEGLFFVRNGSPLIIGIGDEESFISSDIPSFVDHTKDVIIVNDGEYGVLANKAYIFDDEGMLSRNAERVEWSIEVAKKGAYDHYLVKEVMEQPKGLRNAINQNFDPATHLLENKKMVLVGCGTSYHACLLAARYFAKQGIDARTVLGSEPDTLLPFIDDATVLVALSQSGETADVLNTMRMYKEKGAQVLALTNVQTSTLAQQADVTIPLRVGPEICVLSTKAYTAQCAILFHLAHLLKNKKSSVIERSADAAPAVLAQADPIAKRIAQKIKNVNSMFVLGRGLCEPIARESALKIKEVSYIHAEGFAAGELKHGSIALIEEGTPVIIIADDATRQVTLANAMEVKARGAFVIGVDTEEHDVYDIHIPLPFDEATPLLAAMPLQLLAYQLALERGCHPDKPRNLAKSVTVV